MGRDGESGYVLGFHVLLKTFLLSFTCAAALGVSRSPPSLYRSGRWSGSPGLSLPSSSTSPPIVHKNRNVYRRELHGVRQRQVATCHHQHCCPGREADARRDRFHRFRRRRPFALATTLSTPIGGGGGGDGDRGSTGKNTRNISLAATDASIGGAEEHGGTDNVNRLGDSSTPFEIADDRGEADSNGPGSAGAGSAVRELSEWLPGWSLRMHPVLQVFASVALYFFHMLYLSREGITFPVQLVPNKYGLTQSVGLDTAVGFGVLGFAAWARRRSGLAIIPPLRGEGVPWKIDGGRVRKKLPLTVAVLAIAYLLSGLGAHVCEYGLYFLSLIGINLSVAMHRSVQVLVSHLIWVVMGVRILGLAFKSFFNVEKGSWVGMKWRANWLWWVVGGYFVSSSLFNLADLANRFVCPLPPDTESVVVKIINPEDNDIAAMAVGSIAPCVSAPWWEEVLYRGFLLPALTLYLPLKAAVPAGSLLFAAHHMNLQAMLPLSVLGFVWSLVYMYSGNLLVTVLIHAMWNSRVFLGSLLGL